MRNIKINKVKNVQLPEIVKDEFGNKINIDKAFDQAEKHIEAIKSGQVHFRWQKKEIERCKRLAEKKGMPYQTYIKSVLKQAMDNDEDKTDRNQVKKRVVNS